MNILYNRLFVRQVHTSFIERRSAEQETCQRGDRRAKDFEKVEFRRRDVHLIGECAEVWRSKCEGSVEN